MRPARSETQRASARSRSRVLIGALVLAVGALGGAVLLGNAGHRRPVVVAARAVRAGEVIGAPDLTTARVAADPGVATIPAGNETALVGKLAAVALVPGALVAPADVASGPGPTAGQAVIGATLKAGQAPIGLRAGDTVLIVPMPTQQGSTATTTSGGSAPWSGTVVAVATIPDTGGSIKVSLAVPPEAAATLAVAGAQGNLALVLEQR
jgi:Flp pilus assembly protein CpaB